MPLFRRGILRIKGRLARVLLNPSVYRQMFQDLKCHFEISLAQILQSEGAAILAQFLKEPSLQLQDLSSGLLPCFDAWLMVGIDSNEARIQSNRPLIEGNQQSYGKRGDLPDRQSDGFPVVLSQGRAGPQ